MAILDRDKVLQITDVGRDFPGLYIPDGIRKPTNNLICDGKFYYGKKTGVWRTDYREIINELIGSFLARKISLDAVDYKIGVFRNQIYILSEIFFEEGKEYFHPNKLGYDLEYEYSLVEKKVHSIYYYKSMLNNLNEQLLYDILKLTILDIKMGQIDRKSYSNTMLMQDESGISLAPVYDFGEAYSERTDCMAYIVYNNPFIIIRKNVLSMKTLVRKYPIVMEFIDILKNIDMEEIIAYLESSFPIKLSDVDKKYYEEKDSDYSRVLKKL